MRRTAEILSALVLLAIYSAQERIHAQVHAWLEFGGGKIIGEATEEPHQDWIEVEGFSLGGKLAASSPGSFAILKRVDRASPQLFFACAKGTVHDKVLLDVARSSTGPDGSPELCRVELEGVRILSVETEGATGNDFPVETVALAFSRIIYTYILDSQQVISGFDYETGKGSSTDGTTLPDSDFDGMPDDWERANGMTVGVNDAGLDIDGDGFTNGQEFELGTDPRSGASFFKVVLTPVTDNPGSFQLSWNSVNGRKYRVEWSPDLKTRFTTIATVTATGNSSSAIVGTGGTGFFRVSQTP